MVCLGNICRSPIAQGILEEKIKNKIITLGLGSKRNKLKMIGMMISKEELTMRK